MIDKRKSAIFPFACDDKIEKLWSHICKKNYCIRKKKICLCLDMLRNAVKMKK